MYIYIYFLNTLNNFWCSNLSNAIESTRSWMPSKPYIWSYYQTLFKTYFRPCQDVWLWKEGTRNTGSQPWCQVKANKQITDFPLVWPLTRNDNSSSSSLLPTNHMLLESLGYVPKTCPLFELQHRDRKHTESLDEVNHQICSRVQFLKRLVWKYNMNMCFVNVLYTI